MRLYITYEWVFEEYDEYGDIIDPLFGSTLSEVLSNELEDDSHKIGIALVRYEGNKDDGLVIKEYAYINDNKLPIEFDDGYKIPEKFHKEYLKVRGEL